MAVEPDRAVVIMNEHSFSPGIPRARRGQRRRAPAHHRPPFRRRRRDRRREDVDHNGTRADFITLAVRTGAPGYGGISLLTFPTDVKGFSVSKKLQKLGNLSSDTAVLFFEDCRIPQRYVLGAENEGFYHIMTNFQGERL